MSNPDILEVMQTLSKGNAGKTATARLRNIFDEIEIALCAGVKNEVVWEALKKIEGYDMPLRTFESAIYRIRKERGSPKNKKAVKKPVQSGATYRTAEEPEDEQLTTRTGFHQVLEQLAEQSSNKDPRRTT